MIFRVTFLLVSPEIDRLRFDIGIGPDLLPVADRAYFGFWGPFNGEYSQGVLLTSDGQIDLGGDGGQDGRFHRTNLLTKKISVGQYMTVWWRFGLEPEEATYVVESVLQLSALTDLISPSDATSLLVENLGQLPRFRAKVKSSFDIRGYDDRVYRPPVGVEGEVANLHGALVFCPDNAFAKDGERIMSEVNEDQIELIRDQFGPSLDPESNEESAAVEKD